MINVWYCRTNYMYREDLFPTFDRSWESAPMPMPPVSAFQHSRIHCLVGYRTGSTYSSTGLVPALAFSFRYRLNRMLYPPPLNFCSSFPAVLLSHWSIFRCTLYIFNGRLSEQFSGTTLRGTIGYRKAGTSFLKRVTGRIFIISDFMEAIRNFILDLFHKEQQKSMKTISFHTRSIVLIIRTLKKNIYLMI